MKYDPATIEAAAKVADEYAHRMSKSATAREAEGAPNTVATSKADAGESIASAIRALSPSSGWRLVPAARDVLAERQRQTEVEGWTPEHDDQQNVGEIAIAAACYAVGDTDPSDPHEIAIAFYGQAGPYDAFDGWLRWPWSKSWWKPKDRRRNLVRAGALILAEIERLDRAAAAVPDRETGR